VAAALIAVVLCLPSGTGRGAEHPFPKRAPAPEFPADLEWFNTGGPLALEDLRGRFVLLDFWTYCCINCMHILPELAKLEAAFPEELVVIGVHSAKFAEERLGDNIREAILRHRIAHPVVNDADHAIWNRYRVDTWPSLRVIDPEGNLVAAQSGEVEFESLERFFRTAIAHYREAGTLRAAPLALPRERLAAAGPLRFPGKLLVDEAGKRLFVADSGHDRIVVADLSVAGVAVTATLAATIGSGRTGAADGGFEAASFNQPQGLALEPGAGGGPPTTLLVADTENHLLRRVRLDARSVETIAGTGRQSRAVLLGMQPARTTPLNSPWDLLVHGGQIYVAMAGPHQIWRLPGDASVIGVHAGNGREDVVDGPLLPKKPFATGAASFAQPSGLATDGEWLFVADSEGSSIRAVPFAAKPGGPAAAAPARRVRTVVGTSRLPRGRLFTFGDVDGPAETARLQHPLGVAWLDGGLFVADTYNNQVKAVDPASGAVRTVAGSGRRGKGDDPAEFDEPAGIAAGAGLLWIADTNNHAIRVVDPATGTTRTLVIRGLEPPPHVVAEVAAAAPPPAALGPPPGPGSPLAGFGAAKEVDLGRVRGTIVATDSGRVARLVAVATPPEGWKLNDMTPVRWRIEAAGAGPAAPAKPLTGRAPAGADAARAGEFTIDVPLDQQAAAGGPATPLVLVVDAILCEAKGTTCRPSSVRAALSLEPAARPDPAVPVPLP
jgi:sugar lactone lactonase YvrE